LCEVAFYEKGSITGVYYLPNAMECRKNKLDRWDVYNLAYPEKPILAGFPNKTKAKRAARQLLKEAIPDEQL
jgi:hypothetical protein